MSAQKPQVATMRFFETSRYILSFDGFERCREFYSAALHGGGRGGNGGIQRLTVSARRASVFDLFVRFAYHLSPQVRCRKPQPPKSRVGDRSHTTWSRVRLGTCRARETVGHVIVRSPTTSFYEYFSYQTIPVAKCMEEGVPDLNPPSQK